VIWVKFVQEGHRVKVTGAERSRIPVIAMINFCWQYISIRQMAPQTTRRGWSGLRLEGKLVLV